MTNSRAETSNVASLNKLEILNEIATERDILKAFSVIGKNAASGYLFKTITPTLAKGLLSDEFMPNFQRAVNKDNKKQYINDIQNGYFDKSTLTFGVVNKDGVDKFYNIDGRTRLSAVAECGESLDFHIVFNRYNSIDEVKTAYTKIDSGRKRNFVDKIDALEILKDRDVPKELKSKLSDIFSIINGDFPGTYSGKRKGANDQKEKIEAVEAQVKTIETYGKMIAPLLGKTKKESPLKEIFLNPGVAAAIIHLMGNTPNKHTAHFFSDIILGTELDEYQKILLNSLQNLNEKDSDVRKSKYIRIIEMVWNAKIKGKNLKNLTEVKIFDHKSIVSFEFKKPEVNCSNENQKQKMAA